MRQWKTTGTTTEHWSWTIVLPIMGMANNYSKILSAITWEAHGTHIPSECNDGTPHVKRSSAGSREASS